MFQNSVSHIRTVCNFIVTRQKVKEKLKDKTKIEFCSRISMKMLTLYENLNSIKPERHHMFESLNLRMMQP